MNAVPVQPGLTTSVAAEKLRQVGPNVVVQRKHFRPLAAFLGKFNNPLLWIISAASIISFFTGERTNAIILVAMVFLSVFLDFINSYRSEKAVAGLTDRVRTMVSAYRDGRIQDIPLTTVVPGDVIALSAGDVIPADGYVLEEKDLYLNESVLTGESMPVGKQVLTGEAPNSADRSRADALLMGTSVISGAGTMTVLATGSRTSFGAIASRLEATENASDYEKQLRSFSLFLMRITIVMVVIVFTLNFFSDRGLLTSVLFAIAVAIGLTPELLPVIMAVSLSRGAVRMAKQEVIVKHLPAIQNLGRMNILCTDKTGTLTQNQISVVQYLNAGGASDDSVLRLGYISSHFHSGVANPLDGAIVKARSWPIDGMEKIDEEPFDFERRRESIVVNEQGKFVLISKGAPEAVMAISTSARKGGTVVPLDATLQSAMQNTYDQLSSQGFKVLGIGSKNIPAERREYGTGDEVGLTFEGFLAFLDPPKPTAREAIASFEQLGVEMKILTGDGLIVTQKICRDLDLSVRGVITGEELAKLRPDQWVKRCQETTIFARIDPMQKEKIIATLRGSGLVVGFLGDGINDAPALKAADVGVSVNNAVDVAKETADIILLRQSLRVLRDGIVEGRKTFQNTMKYIYMGLSSNFGNMLSMVAASAFLPFLPMLPTQILLNNFLYDMSQISLSTDAVDDEDLHRPSVWNLRHIRRFMLVFGPLSSIFDIVTFVVMLKFFHLQAAQFQTAWFMESLATQVLVIYLIRTNRIPLVQSRPGRWVVLNTLLLVVVAWILPFITIGAAFGLVALSSGILAAIAGITLVYLLLIAIAKRIFNRTVSELAGR